MNNVRENISDIIIDTPERFIGKYLNNRISIVEIQMILTKNYNIEISNEKFDVVTDEYKQLPDMDAAINFAKQIIDKL